MKLLKPSALALAITCVIASNSVAAQDLPTLSNPAISAILDGYYQTSDRPMSEREEGFGLGHTELALSANVDELFFAKMTTVLEVNDSETELNVEEAFIQTLTMPAGFSLRAGRFLSDIGYLNNQHSHTDAFTDRPAAYRAFLGGHYFDDGVRLSYVAPTDIYWTMGVEAFKGNKLRAADEHGEREFETTGVYSVNSKLGGDIGYDSSWQLGVAYLRNENGRLTPHEEEEGHAEEAHDDHSGHSHNAAYTGENTYIADFVYKWAPNGNYKYQHLTLSAEYLYVDGFKPQEGEHHQEHEAEEHHQGSDVNDYHQGWYASGVYQLSPAWSVGLRYGELDAALMHGEHFHEQNLKETEAVLAWHSSHFSTVRLQYVHQNGTNIQGIEDDNIVTLQYIMALGAHGAHQF